MRDYNYRRNKKIKEQNRRKHIIKKTGGWWPTSPSMRENEDGYIYYTDGKKSVEKQLLKKSSNSVLRRTSLDGVSSNSNYKKLYDLWWIWT